jgi:phenylacetate-CoA ligase
VAQRIYNPVTECMSREDLESLQWRKIKLLLERVYHKNEFYRSRFQKAGVTPEKINSVADFKKKIPFITKEDFLADQNEKPPYGKRLMVDQSHIAFTYLTSGTSGKGQEVHAATYREVTESASSWATCFHWAGIMPGDVGYYMLPLGLTAGPISMFMAFHNYGLQTFLVGNLEGEARLDMMKRFPPNFISTGPVYLRRLTNICKGIGVIPKRDFPTLKAIKLGTFGYETSWAHEMEEFWGCRLADSYASSQARSGLASTCENGVYRVDGSRGIMHFLEHKILFEVINPQTGETVADGEEGELIVTPLETEAMPIIRFKTNDKVLFMSHRSCSCGRPYNGIQVGTVSRYDSMIKIRGMNVWPEAVESLVFSYSEIDEYNGRVWVNEKGREDVRLLIEFKTDLQIAPERKKKILNQLKDQCKEKTNVSMDVVEAPPGTIERFVYKEKRWRDLRKEGM